MLYRQERNSPQSILTLIDQSKHSLFSSTVMEKNQAYAGTGSRAGALADRVAVPAGIAEIVLRNDLIRDGIAERTSHGRLHASNPLTSIKYLHFSIKLSNGNFLPVRCRVDGSGKVRLPVSRSNFWEYSFCSRFQYFLRAGFRCSINSGEGILSRLSLFM